MMEPASSVLVHRVNGARTWDLPQWNHPVGGFVFPLFIRTSDKLLPIGTAFSVSRYGLVVTARHCIENAFAYHRLGRPRVSAGNYDLDDVGFCVLHHRLKQDGSTELNLISASRVCAAMPSDVVYMTLHLPASKPLPCVKISPIMPRHDSSVLAVGYCEFCPTELVYDDVKAGRFDWKNQYQHTLRACIGTVGARFPRMFAPGFLEAGCFMSTCDTTHGQSGGPVFNGEGYVCGITSSGADMFFGVPSNLVSSLYPALALSVRLDLGLSNNVRMALETDLRDLIVRGLVGSDGSERLHYFANEDGRIRIDPPYSKDDLVHIYDDFHGFQAGTAAKTGPRPV